MAHAMALTISASFQFPHAEIILRSSLQSCVRSQLTSCHIVHLLTFVLHGCWFQPVFLLMKFSYLHAAKSIHPSLR